MDDQEAYLKTVGVKEIIIRGVKKMLTELTSVKFLAMGGIFCLLVYGKVDSLTGIVGILAILGIRDLPESIVQRISGSNKPPDEDISKQ